MNMGKKEEKISLRLELEGLLYKRFLALKDYYGVTAYAELCRTLINVKFIELVKEGKIKPILTN
jgi:hypothetical protein